MTTKAYWDSCVFIDLLEKTAGRYPACEECWGRAQLGELEIVTSAITIAEVCKLPSSGLLPEEQSQQILDFFESECLTIRQVDRAVAEEAHRLTRVYGLKPMDAIHVATALVMKVDVLHTFDAAGGRRKGLLTHDGKIGSPPLRITAPPPPSGLFAGQK